VPNAGDLIIWQLFRAVTKVKDDIKSKTLRYTFEAAVLDHHQWEDVGDNKTQSQGLHKIPFPTGEAVTLVNMARHLKQCRVMCEFVEHSLLPYVQRNQAAAAERRSTPLERTMNPPIVQHAPMVTQSSGEAAPTMLSIYAEIPMDGIDSTN
jgi:hypothetical protein